MDILAGRTVVYDDYGSVRCDRNRRIVVGITRPDMQFPEGIIREGKRILDRRVEAFNYAVSPNGRFVAWVSDLGLAGGMITVQSSRGASGTLSISECGLPSGISISDFGDVLFDCSWGVLEKQFSIKEWRPGLARPRLLLDDAAGAEWVTPAAARALIARYEYLGKHPQVGQPR